MGVGVGVVVGVGVGVVVGVGVGVVVGVGVGVVVGVGVAVGVGVGVVVGVGVGVGIGQVPRRLPRRSAGRSSSRRPRSSTSPRRRAARRRGSSRARSAPRRSVAFCWAERASTLGGLEPAVHVQAHGRAVERHRHVVPRIGLQRRSADHRVDAATRPALEHDALATVRRGAVRRDYQRVSVVGRVGLLADHAAPAGGGVGARGPDPSLEREGRGAGVIVGVTETDGRRVTEAGRGIRRVPRRRREAEPDAARIAAAARAPGIERGRPGRLAQAPVKS